jgi:hypothetical protein
MKIAGIYSFNQGKERIEAQYPSALNDVRAVIAAVNSDITKIKISSEKTVAGRMLYDPKLLNSAFREQFSQRGWIKHRVACEYPTEYYTEEYQVEARKPRKGAFREMDFVKERLGVEVQFGKYAFMVYNVAAKMTIFKNLNIIDVGIEIVPIKRFADEMSTGVSYFEQFVWDLEHRGVSNIDIPVLILGVMA